MFGNLGKQFAAQIGEKVEELVAQRLEERDPQSRARYETATEQLSTLRPGARRKGLFVGINYAGQRGQLRGCINDVRNISQFLQSRYQFHEILILTDDQIDPNKKPTRANMMRAFRWLREGAKAGDSLILHYSGHGGYVKDLDGDEDDGYDETLIPLDHATAGPIVDDEIHAVLCRDLPKGVRLTAIVDCCHSATVLDLPYTYNVNGNLEIVEGNAKHEGIAKLAAAGTKFLLDGDKKAFLPNLGEGFKLILSSNGNGGGGDSAKAQRAREITVRTRTTRADVICFSGCRDSQTSADATIDGNATGAMSYALIRCLGRNPQSLTYTSLLREMRKVLSQGRYTQVPMLSAGRKLVLEEPFSI